MNLQYMETDTPSRGFGLGPGAQEPQPGNEDLDLKGALEAMAAEIKQQNRVIQELQEQPAAPTTAEEVIKAFTKTIRKKSSDNNDEPRRNFISKPEPFKGTSTTEACRFLNQINLYFLDKPRDFPKLDNAAHIHFSSSYFKNKPCNGRNPLHGTLRCDTLRTNALKTEITSSKVSRQGSSTQTRCEPTPTKSRNFNRQSRLPITPLNLPSIHPY